MKVKELMTSNVIACDLNASLTEAAKMMWDNDCGVLPVLKDCRELVGLITDRDICMGASIRDRNLSSVSVEEVMTGAVYSVSPEEEVRQALTTMQEHRVRRLPVVDSEGQLTGILSMNDVTLAEDSDLSQADVIETYRAICAHPVETKEQSLSATV